MHRKRISSQFYEVIIYVRIFECYILYRNSFPRICMTQTQNADKPNEVMVISSIKLNELHIINIKNMNYVPNKIEKRTNMPNRQKKSLNIQNRISRIIFYIMWCLETEFYVPWHFI